MLVPQVRYRQAPVYKTQNKSRAQTNASPSVLSCKQKNGGFLLGTITPLTLNFIISVVPNRIKPIKPHQKKGHNSMFMLQVRYHHAPVHKTQTKSRAQTGASLSALSCKQKLTVFS